MGAEVLVVVGDSSILQRPQALAMAAGGRSCLENACVVDTLDEALSDCVLAVGFTARGRVRREPVLRLPRSASHEILAAAQRGPVALVFGREDRGLSNRDLDRCALLIHIPGSEGYPVLNLAASVMVALYELRAACGSTTTTRAVVPAARALDPAAVPASLEEMERLYERFRGLLCKVRFLRRRETQGMVTLRGLLGRAELQKREVAFLMGALRALDGRLPPEGAPPSPSASPVKSRDGSSSGPSTAASNRRQSRGR